MRPRELGAQRPCGGTLYLVFDEVPSEHIDMAGPLLEYESAMFMEVMDDGLFISAK